MPKVLSLAPTEGESPEAFAKRAAEKITSFFGVTSGDAEEATAPADETDAPTDGIADSEEAPEEEQPEG